MGRAALLIIDMQNDFVSGGKTAESCPRLDVVPQIQSVLADFRERNLPVFHIVRVHRKDGSDVEIIRQDLFAEAPFAVEGTPGAAVIDELAPRAGEHAS